MATEWGSEQISFGRYRYLSRRVYEHIGVMLRAACMFPLAALLHLYMTTGVQSLSAPERPSGGSQYIHNTMESTQRQTVLNKIFSSTSRSLWQRAQIPANARILEIGCGTGASTRDLAMAYPQASILAIDANPQLIDAASLQHSDLPNVNWATLTGEAAMDQLREQFDVVWMRFVVVHVPDPQHLIASAVACLQPGGTLLVEDCHANGWFCDPPLYACQMLHEAHVRASLELGADVRRGPWIGGYMRKAGLQEISVETFCPVFQKGIQMTSPWWDPNEVSTEEQFELGLQLLQQSLDSLSPKFLELNICSQLDIDQARESIQEVSQREYQMFCIPGGHIFQWIGTKPKL